MVFKILCAVHINTLIFTFISLSNIFIALFTFTFTFDSFNLHNQGDGTLQ